MCQLGTDEVRMQIQGGQTSQEAKLVSKLGPLLFWEHHGAKIIKAVIGFNHFLKGLWRFNLHTRNSFFFGFLFLRKP